MSTPTWTAHPSPEERLSLQQWSAEGARLPVPAGRWAVQRDRLRAGDLGLAAPTALQPPDLSGT